MEQQNTICKYGCKKAVMLIKFLPFKIPKDPFDRYTFHLSVYCGVCDKWQKHVKQSPELIEKLSHITLFKLQDESNNQS